MEGGEGEGEFEGAVAGAVCSIADSLCPGPSSIVTSASTRVAGSQRPNCDLSHGLEAGGLEVRSLCLTRQLATYLLRLLASVRLPSLDPIPQPSLAREQVPSHNPGNGTGTRGPLDDRRLSKPAQCRKKRRDERIKI